jgi:microcystin-dependent protein
MRAALAAALLATTAHAQTEAPLTIAPSGHVGVGTASPAAPLDVQAEPRTGEGHPEPNTLYVTGKLPAGRPGGTDAPGIEFRHSNGTQGIGIGHNTIYATGTNADQSLKLQPMPDGAVEVLGPLTVTGALSGPAVEAIRAEIARVVRSLVPLGTIMAYGGEFTEENRERLAVAGWIPCDGAALDRGDYGDLFAVIGTAHGAPDAARFNAPDCRGRFLRGADKGAGHDPDAGTRVAAQAGGATGDRVGTYQADQFASHTHSQQALGDHARGGMAGGTYWAQPTTRTGATGGAETRPRNIAVNWIVKAVMR